LLEVDCSTHSWTMDAALREIAARDHGVIVLLNCGDSRDTELELWSREWMDKIDEPQLMHWVERFVTVAERWQRVLRGEVPAATPNGKSAFDHLNRHDSARHARLSIPLGRER